MKDSAAYYNNSMKEMASKWQICSSYAMEQKKKIRKKCIIRKDFCMTLPCVDKFCGDNRSSLEGEQSMCLFPERRGLSSAAQCPFHLTLSLQGSQSVRPHFLWTKSRHTKARTQCWCPTPHLCSIFNKCTGISKHSVLTCHWYSSQLTEGSDCWLHPNL